MTISPRQKQFVLPILSGMAAVVAGCYFLNVAATSHGLGFPLDDPWIHLQFARNLHDFGSFSYFKNQMVTSGSTSPLYTSLLAAGMFVSSQELQLSYVFGIAAFAALCFLTCLIAGQDRPWYVFLMAGLLTALEPRLIYASVSGMETTLFAALLMATLLAYKSRRPVALGVLLGLTLWTRPEGILFAAVLWADLLYEKHVVHRVHSEGRKKLHPKPQEMFSYRLSILIFAGFGIAYLVWNMILSGTPLPNTYAAKTLYYGRGPSDFPHELWGFIGTGHMMPFLLFVALGLVDVLLRVRKGHTSPELVPALFSCALIGAYWLKLPHLYQEGRYLMPILPFLVLIAMRGLENSAAWVGKRVAMKRKSLPALLVGVVFVVQFLSADDRMAKAYDESCAYISARQVATARWIETHLPPDAVLATHDIGALAFYGKRKIVDMVGLVSPDMIARIGSFGGLRQFLVEHHVTHLAVLRNWFEVANQTALFQTNESTPEVMEVFTFDPVRTKFISQDVTRAMMTAQELLWTGRAELALPYLDWAVRTEGTSSRAHYLFAAALDATGRKAQAEAEVQTALRLQPDYQQAASLLVALRSRTNTEAQ
jgi:hypothetical protein